MRNEAQQITEQNNRISVPAVAGAALLTAINLLEFPTVLYVESEPEYGVAVSLTFAILGMLPLVFMESVPIARDSYGMFGNLQQSMHDLVDYIKAHPVISASIMTSAMMDSLPGMVDGSSLIKKWTDSDVAANVVMAVLAVGLNINYVFAYGKPTAEYLEQMSRKIARMMTARRRLDNPDLDVPLLADEDEMGYPLSTTLTSMILTTMNDAAAYYLSLNKLAGIITSEQDVFKYFPLMPLQWLKTMGSLRKEFEVNFDVFRLSPCAALTLAKNKALASCESAGSFTLAVMGLVAATFLNYVVTQDFLDKIGLIPEMGSEYVRKATPEGLAVQSVIMVAALATFIFSVAPRFFRREEEVHRDLIEAWHQWTPRWNYQRLTGLHDDSALTPARTHEHTFLEHVAVIENLTTETAPTGRARCNSCPQ